MTAPTKPEGQLIAIRLPDEMAKALRKLCDAEDRTLSAEVRRAIRSHLDANGKGGT